VTRVTRPRPFRIPAAALCWLALVLAPLPALSQGIAGSYLAARHASLFSDYRAAAEYFGRALLRDPRNPQLLESATMAHVGLGQIDRAAPIARRLLSLGARSQIAHLVVVADRLWAEDFESVRAELETEATVGPLVDGLLTAWAEVGQGRMTDALDHFREIAGEDGVEVFGLYHQALALALVGDFESADDILSGRAEGPLRLTRRGVIAHVQVLSNLQRNADAIELLEAGFGPRLDPALQDLHDRLAAGETLPFDTVRNAKDGAAEVFLVVAGALAGDAADGYTLLYSRIAEYLRPDHVDAILLSASLLEQLERYALATETLNRVPRDHPSYAAAELGRSDALRKSGRDEAAVEVLEQLARTYPENPEVFISLGDTLRSMERFDEASRAYDRAVALYPDPEGRQWLLFFARGIAHERVGRWPQAEADFRQALELNPGQPQVLNYLGYSFVEMGINFDEALDMIERAVAAEPESGYITDSLGWVLFRMGDYAEAVGHLERAAELLPVDPVVNDHLGDAYWAVGRKIEAEFQWKRALSFDPDEDDATRIRRKLEIGLDEVLMEEGGEPIHVATDG